MKTHVLTACWKRPEITRICFEGIKRLGLQATAAISEKSYIPMCEEYGINWVMIPNNPLGAKWNAGLKEALKHEWDYLLILGSDDLISDDLIDKYHSLKDWDMIGVKDFYIYQDGKVKYFNYRKNRTVGAGRMIKRTAIKGELWEPWRNKGLDGSCSRKMKKWGMKEKVISMGDSIVVDIKSDTNINSFEKLEGEIVDIDLSDLCTL